MSDNQRLGADLDAVAPQSVHDAWATAVEVAAFERSILGATPLAYADCQRCGAPAHPIRGYCGRFCEEAARDESTTLAILGAVVDGLDPVTPEETTAAYAEVFAALKRDTDDALAAWAPTFGPALAWSLEPHPFTRERFEAGVERALRGPGDDEP